MKRLKKYILIGFLGTLTVSSVFMTVVTATSGAEVSTLQKEEIRLSNQKRYLEETLVKTLSTSELQEKSGDLGFIKPINLVYMALPEAVAKLP
jgi:hypothetical protein